MVMFLIRDKHSELGTVVSVLSNDSESSNIQHMAIVRDFVF